MTHTRHVQLETTLGAVTLVAEDDALIGLYFRGHWPRPDASAFGELVDVGDDEFLARAGTDLTDYLAGRRRTFEVPANARGDEFDERVWAMLADVPYGTTTSYGDLAGALGDRRLAQRVGQAVGRNPVCVIIPCHRVVGAGGALTGYAGGLARKRLLLELEEPAAVSASRLF